MNTFNLADIFTDYAVLQRNQQIVIWGNGENNTTITVTLAGEKRETRVSNNSWRLSFPQMQAMDEVSISVESNCKQDQPITLSHIAVGEVWLAGGQSNMWFPLKYDMDYREHRDGLSEDPYIRFYDTPRISYDTQKFPTEDSGIRGWEIAKKCNWENLSAVSLYFASSLRKALNVPIGIVECNWGGSTASTWVKKSYLTNDLEVYIKEYEKNRLDQDIAFYNQQVEKAIAWGQTQQHKILFDKMLFGIQSKEDQKEMEVLRGMEVGLPLGCKHPYRPEGLYQTMLEGIIPYAIQGVIWYQGESDSHHPDIYKELFTALVNCWRTAWNREFPFLTVQLSSFEEWSGLVGNYFPVIREMQEQASKELEHVYMVCSMDLGMKNDIHPKRKKPIGERLAVMARNKVYGETILCESPVIREVRVYEDIIEMSFNCVGQGLIATEEEIEGFEVFYREKTIGILKISLSADKITLKLSETFPKERDSILLQYAWKPYVAIQLYNSVGLPMKPFRKSV